MKERKIIFKKILIMAFVVSLFLAILPTNRALAAGAQGPGIFYIQRPDMGHLSFKLIGNGTVKKINFFDNQGNLLETYTDVIINTTIKTLPTNSKYLQFYLDTNKDYITKIDLYFSGGPAASYNSIDNFTSSNIVPNLPNPTPVPSETPTATATPVPTATPSATPSPTVTPTATPTPAPTATPKPTPTATPEQPAGDRALLTITFVNGTEKEYDLPMSELDAFLNWYDARDAGRGPGMYAIDKHTNNKGPFKKRKDYVVFDKILTYEVSEYLVTD